MNRKQCITLLACCFSLILLSCEDGDDKKEITNRIEVTGSAEMEVTPDEIYMTFTLREYLDAGKKKVDLEQLKSEFLSLCKKAGVADSNISVSGYSGHERHDYSWYKRRKSEPEFMGSISYLIKASSSEKLDEIIAGMNQKAVENFWLTKTSHSNLVELRKEVKTNALKAAKLKAEYLAESIGEEVGEALLIQEIESGYRDYSNMRMSNNITTWGEESENSTPSFEKIKIRYEMRADFRLK
ncbi:MAG: SIMPL domain-containing protein [Bacteroidia bacterium]